MNIYQPDYFVIVKITYKEKAVYKVLGSWSSGNWAWRLSSGIVGVVSGAESHTIKNHSGSEYIVNKDSEMLMGDAIEIYGKMVDFVDDSPTIEKVEIVELGDVVL